MTQDLSDFCSIAIVRDQQSMVRRMQKSKEKAGFKAKYWIQVIDLGLPEYVEMSEKDWGTSSKYLAGDPRKNGRTQEAVQSEMDGWNPRENPNLRGEI